MTIATKKKIAWVVFMLNLGSLLIFYFMLLVRERDWRYWRELIAWPIISMLTVLKQTITVRLTATTTTK